MRSYIQCQQILFYGWVIGCHLCLRRRLGLPILPVLRWSNLWAQHQHVSRKGYCECFQKYTAVNWVESTASFAIFWKCGSPALEWKAAVCCVQSQSSDWSTEAVYLQHECICLWTVLARNLSKVPNIVFDITKLSPFVETSAWLCFDSNDTWTVIHCRLTNIIIFGVVRFLLGAITFAVRYGKKSIKCEVLTDRSEAKVFL